MARAREPPPPPVIGKYGLYTVFITPPSAPNLVTSIPNPSPNPTPIPQKDAPLAPIQVPPQQFEKPSGLRVFWEAVAKVQDAHSRLDGYLADWFGLNQSKYQWALDDYHESNAMRSGKREELDSED